MTIKIIEGKFVYKLSSNYREKSGVYLLEEKMLEQMSPEDLILNGLYLKHYGTVLDYGCGIDNRFLIPEHVDYKPNDEIVYVTNKVLCSKRNTYFALCKYNIKTRMFGNNLDKKTFKEAFLDGEHVRTLSRNGSIFYSNISMGADIRMKSGNDIRDEKEEKANNRAREILDIVRKAVVKNGKG